MHYGMMKRSMVFLLVLAVGLVLSFTVTQDPVHAAAKAKKITLKAQAQTVDIGGSIKVEVKSVTPKKASKKVSWKASKGSKFAKLSKKKATSVTITGKKAGTVTVKATAKSGKAAKTVKIKVKDLKAKSVKLSATNADLAPGETVTLKAAVTAPQKYGYKKQTSKWSSSDPAVAKVTANGKVTAVGAGTAKITVANDGKTATCTVTVTEAVSEFPIPEGTVLKKYGITGYYEEGIDSINTVALDDVLQVAVWNKDKKFFVYGTTADINGNYTSLVDVDGNGKADLCKVVRFADGPIYWDATAAWVDGIGANTIPNTFTDAEGRAMFDVPFRVPMGERMLTEFGLGAYSGTTDWANLSNGGYWENNAYDFYQLTSSDTLTMLTGYKTELQPSGSLCVMSSASTVLEWYGQRQDLTEIDLALLRGNDCTEKRGTSLTQAIQVFHKLGELGLTCEWDMETYNDFEGAEMDSEWVQAQLAKGHPIIVISNSYGPHGQVIIGYDNMGTEDTLDDVCIMMDPYDTTDQNNNGYIIQPFERLQWSALTWSDEEYATGCKYMAVWPKDPSLWDETYTQVMGEGMQIDAENQGNFSDEMKLDYGNTAADLDAFYPSTPYRGSDGQGLAGAATNGYERSGDYDQSPYFTLNDYYNLKDGDLTGSLKILEQFKTIQQATEWTCGTASALMNIEWFGKNEIRTAEDDPGKGYKETDVSLASHRQIDAETGIGRAGATSQEGLKEVFQYMSEQYGQEWTVFTNQDLDDPEGEESYIGDYCLQAGSEDEDWPGLIPYLIDNGIPMIIGSDEWGGHWQVIIGYDSMGTEATQDDVLILADPYDTTDHNQDGYVIKGFERLVYGWNSSYEKRFDGPESNDFVVAFPTEGHEEVIETLGLQ